MAETKKRKGLRLLFLSYWSADEPLVRSTIVPYLRLMAEGHLVEEVWLLTVERGGDPVIAELEGLPGVHHAAIGMRNKGKGLWSKVDVFVRLFLLMFRMVRRHRIDAIDSKGAVAGGMAFLVHRVTGTPFIVESFEPHSDYMADSGTWSRSGIYFRMAGWLERMQCRYARFLVTVTHNYARELKRNGYSEHRVRVIPSITNLELFRFDEAERESVRGEMGWTGSIVGVYVGKFGGMYFDREAFEIFRTAHEVFGQRFRLLLLTRDPVERIEQRLAAVGIARELVEIRFEEHQRVPRWLSAADFAYSLVVPSTSSPYMSPVKNGEYWAAGLPILINEGVADDYHIIRESPAGGAIYDIKQPGTVKDALESLRDRMAHGLARQACMELAREHRSIEIAKSVYEDMFSAIGKEAD
jgi:hypothetical protein